MGFTRYSVRATHEAGHHYEVCPPSCNLVSNPSARPFGKPRSP